VKHQNSLWELYLIACDYWNPRFLGHNGGGLAIVMTTKEKAMNRSIGGYVSCDGLAELRGY